MKQSYRGQAKQAANAIWGSSAAHVRYKHITVVDDDIDIHDYAAVDWAIAYRVNAGENDVIIMPATFGAGLDPSTRRRDRNPALFGTGKWNRAAHRRHHEPRLRPGSRISTARASRRWSGRRRPTPTPPTHALPNSGSRSPIRRSRRAKGRPNSVAQIAQSR